ncbi:MAG TPA: anhydro-N-acetylmuramic acid kinase, partial [Chitinophagaceae bacterium]|nr:anhydro-N-acetylmuramic acid kinase [Chitinophagaceae bacterium]
GGIANITIRKTGDPEIAFDICVANQALNALAQRIGKEYDEEGRLAASGKLLEAEIALLEDAAYYRLKGPKSLSNEQAMGFVSDFVHNDAYSIEDRLHTLVHMIAGHIERSIDMYFDESADRRQKMLVTGGGAFNTFLVQLLREKLTPKGIEIEIPSNEIVMYKEALVMSLIGILRWREETNTLHEVTGASRSSIGGAYWMGA